MTALPGARDTIRYDETYLGDGAYCYLSACKELVFFTANGITESNHVVIEYGDIPSIHRFISRIPSTIAAAQNAAKRGKKK